MIILIKCFITTIFFGRASQVEKYFNKSLSAEAAAGQLFLFGFDGTRYEKRLERFFSKVRPAGVILFSANIENGPQTKTLISDP